MSQAPVSIGTHLLGGDAPCLVIAEAGVNHNGRLDLALQLVEAAAGAGADAVKFQTFSADLVASADAPKAGYQLEHTSAGESQRDMLRALELSAGDHRTLQRRCEELGVMFLSTPFDQRSADLLEDLHVPAFKVSSGELTNVLLLEHLAAKGLPILLSTGMASLAEVNDAVTLIRRAGAPLVLLQCTSDYPASPASANLRAMQTMAREFDVPVGLSDHTPGIAVAIAAVALGAVVIEKHLTLDRSWPGPDHQASLEPGDFAALVRGVRDAQAALGDGVKRPTEQDRAMAEQVRRSLVAARDLPSGHQLTAADVTAKRPGSGLPPRRLADLLGRRLARGVSHDERLSLDMFESPGQERG